VSSSCWFNCAESALSDMATGNLDGVDVSSKT
jgi:hypothetical protein